uniref:AlNc14C35G3128 protein n=1 Tax=Albugo laibachii Nc14 TaxID=890382 RepID=F0W8K2_9STRA|nr:AlNc14C35G3128 [Albugo laibachii Nc14]|eukprot:CCA17457.1 AlNc14C35G3128 [Albugo laibachii Nc14]
MEVDDTGVGLTTEATGAPAKTDPRPTLADILKGKEEIRKDKAAKQARFKAAMPKPIAADVRAVEKLFANGRPSWDVLSAHLTAAKPFVVPSAKFSMVLETGQALAGTPPTQILESFARDHGNRKVEELLTHRAIGQLAKLPGGNLRLLVRSEEVCQQLAHEQVTILGKQHVFREYDLLGSRYYLDIFGLGPDISTSSIAAALHSLGCDILYDNFREAVASKGISMPTWRVYFHSTSTPPPLIVSG